MKMEQSVPKRRYLNSRRRGITPKKAYNSFTSDYRLPYSTNCGYSIRLGEIHKLHIVGHVKELYTAHSVNNISRMVLPCNITNRKCVCIKYYVT